MLIEASTGASLMTPDVGTAVLCGDEPVEGLDDDAALVLVDWTFLPHYTHDEKARAQLLAYSQEQQVRVFGCPALMTPESW